MPPIPSLPLSVWLTTLPTTLLRFTAQSTVSFSLISLETYHPSYCLIPRSLDLLWAPTSWLIKDDASSASHLPPWIINLSLFLYPQSFFSNIHPFKDPTWTPPFIDHSLVVVKSSLCNLMKKGLKSGNCQILSSWTPKSLQRVTEAAKLKDASSLKGKLRQT